MSQAWKDAQSPSSVSYGVLPQCAQQSDRSSNILITSGVTPVTMCLTYHAAHTKWGVVTVTASLGCIDWVFFTWALPFPMLLARISGFKAISESKESRDSNLDVDPISQPHPLEDLYYSHPHW